MSIPNLSLSFFIACASLGLLFMGKADAARGRPVIKKVNGLYQLQTDDGRPIRGTMFNAYNSPDNFAKCQSMPWADYWPKWRVTSTRVWARRKMTSGGVDYGTYGSLPEDKLEKTLDYIVEQCAKNNLYAIIDYHDVSGNTNNAKSPESDAYKFWSKYGPRYKDRTHVIFELYNEPTFGYGLTDRARQNINDLYKHLRALAPKSHIIMLSLGKYSYDGTIVSTADKLVGVDWTNASVGIHTYALNTGDAGVAALKAGSAKYALIMTESGGQQDKHFQLYEKAAIAWTGMGNIGKPIYTSHVTWDGGYGGKLPTTATAFFTDSRSVSGGLPVLATGMGSMLLFSRGGEAARADIRGRRALPVGIAGNSAAPCEGGMTAAAIHDLPERPSEQMP